MCMFCTHSIMNYQQKKHNPRTHPPKTDTINLFILNRERPNKFRQPMKFVVPKPHWPPKRKDWKDGLKKPKTFTFLDSLKEKQDKRRLGFWDPVLPFPLPFSSWELLLLLVMRPDPLPNEELKSRMSWTKLFWPVPWRRRIHRDSCWPWQPCCPLALELICKSYSILSLGISENF